jgi:hypothetical protein
MTNGKEALQLFVRGLLIFTLIAGFLTSCSGASDAPKQMEPKKTASPTPTATKPNSQVFEETVYYWIRSKLYFLEQYASNNGELSLQKFVYDYGVDVDENFEIAEVYLNAQIGGEDADLNLGAQVGIFGDLLGGSAEAKVFCAGENYGSLGTFFTFVEEFLDDRKFYDDDLKLLDLPSKGIRFKMNWREVRTSTDKFGAETETYREIGFDRVTLSSANILKIAEPSDANFAALSDLESPKRAKSSWYSGLCATSQKMNN